jgi:hypothetical protein
MTIISPLNQALTARITLFDGSIAGFREIASFGSILQVLAAPFSDLERMKATINGIFVTYVIDLPRIYTGHGRGSTRNIGDRIDQDGLETSQVYIICSSDPRFEKFAASYVEARIIDIADGLGVPLANILRPYGRGGLRVSADLEPLVQHALFLLSVAGFQRFEETRCTRSDRPLCLSVTGDLYDVRLLDPAGMTVPADADRMRLIRRDLQAEGYMVGDRFHVLPNADFCFESKSGLSEDNLLRRQAIEGLNILQPLPDVTDRARLPVGLDCKSPAIAAKILSGEHIGNRYWQEIPSSQIGSPS